MLNIGLSRRQFKRLNLVRFMRFFADVFFAGRYGHRAVVPGMVGGAVQHLHSLRKMKDDDGWIHILLEEEAVYSYTEYLEGVDNGTYVNISAPQIAIDYWKLPADARLREVIIAVRADEAKHRDVNHGLPIILSAN